MYEYLNWLVRGIPMGLANLLPGLSAGTIALLLGYYGQVLTAIRQVQVLALLSLGVGVGVSLLLGAHAVVWLMDHYSGAVNSFLIGLVLASVWVVISQVTQRRWNHAPFFVIGFGITFFLIDGSFQVTQAVSPLWLFGAGVLSGSAMLLPGVSGATILVVLGVYEPILQAVARWDIFIVLPFGAGAACGLLLLAWIVSRLLKLYPSLILMLLAGMILGSVRSLVELSWSFLHVGWLLGGFSLVILIGMRPR